MKFWRKLRWRLIGSQIVVVIVGVVSLLMAAQFVAQRYVPAHLVTTLTELLPANPELVEQIMVAVTDTLQRVLLQSLPIAALAATVAGLIALLFLIREILNPLEEIAASSERIANGHYGERLATPYSDELALVATNFNQMAESLQQTEQQRIQLIGDVAHELRTPLTGVRGYLEGLLDGLFPPNTETFALMYQEVGRLQRLVDDLQALSRVEAGDIELHIHPFDLNELVHRVCAQAHPQIVASDLTLIADCTDDELLVRADVDRTTQVLTNLLSNAIRYTPEGGHVTVGVTRDGRFAHVVVIDTGVGIAEDDLRHIFERFFRTDKARSRQAGGSGIGLTIARHLIWAMGGDLTVHSEGPGKGSAFGFTLPVE